MCLYWFDWKLFGDSVLGVNDLGLPWECRCGVLWVVSGGTVVAIELWIC